MGNSAETTIVDKQDFKVSASIIIHSDQGVFLIHEADGWGPPSGHMEDQDSGVPQAALRETHEETGFGIELWVGDDLFMPGPAKPIGVIKHPSGFGFVFHGIVVGGTGVATDPEILARGWFDQSSVHRMIAAKEIRRPEYNIPFLVDQMTPEEHSLVNEHHSRLGITIYKNEYPRNLRH